MGQEKKYKKQLNRYIKENLSKGYSLAQIRKVFIKYGYDPEFTENLIRDYRIKSTIARTSSVFLVLLLLLISVVLFYKPGITTLIVATKEYNFTDEIGLSFDESTNYTWDLENKGLLKSVMLNGEVKINGTVKIYLEYGNTTYLIFYNKRLEEKGLGEITGFVIKEIGIKVEIIGNLSVEEQIIIDNLIKNINETKNNVEIEIKVEGNEVEKKINGDLSGVQTALIDVLVSILEDNEEYIKIKIESEFWEIEIPEETINITPINLTNITIINETNITIPTNETLINITEPLNETINVTPTNITNVTIINETIENITISKTIEINLEYKKDTIYDINDDGVENMEGVIDLTVENSDFNWEADESKLCTRWNIYSIENKENALVCYGSSKCCNFADLMATRSVWNEPFYFAYGQYGISLDNLVSAQVLYVDYNLSLDMPYAEIYYSEWVNLTAKFYKEDFIRFKDICIESCILPSLNATNYALIFEINNSSLRLDSIDYKIDKPIKINAPPILQKNFSNISFAAGQSYTINLSKHFYDEDNDTLIFGFYNNTKIDVKIINETAILTSDTALITYLFFTANDSIATATSNVFKVEVEERRVTAIDETGLKSLRMIAEAWP